ncbi:MAG: hypothetical protein ACERKN_10690 [Velocimicrobium sp.]
MRNVIKRVMVVLMALCILLGMTPVSTQAATKTITYKAYKTTYHNNLIILLKNNTKKVVGVETTVKFYDEAGKEVAKTTEQVSAIYGNGNYVQYIYPPLSEDYTEISYSKYKVSVKAIKAEPYGFDTTKLALKAGSYNKAKKGIEVKITNNGKKKCYTTYYALFFKDKKLVADIIYGSDLIKPKGTDKNYVLITDFDGTMFKYDSVKFVINDATEYDPFQEGY